MTARRCAANSATAAARCPRSDRIAAAERLAEQLLALPFAPASGYVAGYWAMDGEIALHVWQLRLPRECVYCLPVLHEDGRLRFAPWRPGDAAGQQPHGIPEPDVAPTSLLDPEQMSLVVAPLVGFDERGHRLGMGGGWYDRSFAFRHAARRAAVAGRRRLRRRSASTRSTRADWDVALDAVCTESTTHRLQQRAPA